MMLPQLRYKLSAQDAKQFKWGFFQARKDIAKWGYPGARYIMRCLSMISDEWFFRGYRRAVQRAMGIEL